MTSGQEQTRGRCGDRRSAAFVGRDNELATVAAALRDPSAVVVIEGEAGVGKTRLVSEALAALSAPRS